MPLETDSTLAPALDKPEADSQDNAEPDHGRVEPRSRPPESWMDPVRDGVRARLFDSLEPAAPEVIKIGRYIVIKRIGAGGMGMVYAAYDDQLDRKVAVKLLRPGHQRVSPTAQARLTREAQAIARLSHPSVVKVYEVGVHRDEVFVAMEYVDGTTLKQWQAKRGWKEILGRYVAAGRGLEAAHAAGIVHRDFKADNVLVRRDAPTRADGVRVLDFGLASTDPQGAAATHAPDTEDTAPRTPNDSAVTSLTHTGAVMGTPAYMAPEQHAAGATDGRTDQFSFCVSLFEALHGFRPFAGETLEALRANVLAGAIEDDPRYNELPAALSAALRRGLQVNPDDRFPSMGALLDELELDERPRWKRAAVGVGIVAVAATAVLQLGVADTGDLVAEAARVRSEFESTRSANAAQELRALRARTTAEQWDDLVLTYAQHHLSSDPTAVLAALKHLRPASAASVHNARGLAADAARRGPVYDALDLNYPIERLVSPGAAIDPDQWRFAGVSASGALLRVDVGSSGVVTAKVDLGLDLGLGGALVHDAAVTPTGGLLVVTDDQMLRGVSPDGTTLAPPRNVGDAVRVAVDSRGKRVALGQRDGTIAISDALGNERRELRGATHPITHLAFHPRRPTLASATAGSEVWMWFLDRETHRTLSVQSPVEHLAFDNGALIATTADGGMHWDDLTGAHHDPTWAEGATDARTASASETMLEATAEGLRARWGPERPERTVTLDRSDGSRTFALSGDGRWAVASFASRLRMWDLRTDETGVRVTGERAVQLAGDERVVGLERAEGGLVAFAASGAVYRIEGSADAPGSAAELEATLPMLVVRSLAGPEGRRVALVDNQGALHVADIDNPGDVRGLGQQLPLHDGMIAWSPTGTALLKCACPRDRQACTVSVHGVDGSVPTRLGSVGAPATALRVAADGLRALSGHADRTVLWSFEDPGRGKRVEVPAPPPGVERSRVAFAFAPSGRVRLATAERASGAPGPATLRVWESFASGGSLLELFVEANLTALASTSGEEGLVLATADRRTLLWMLDEDKFRALPDGVLDTVGGDASLQIHVAPNRRNLWIAAGAGDALVVDLDTGHSRTLPPLVPPVAWTPEGSLADVVRFREIRQWSSPAPAAPEPFLAWLNTRTRIAIPAETLLSGD